MGELKALRGFQPLRSKALRIETGIYRLMSSSRRSIPAAIVLFLAFLGLARPCLAGRFISVDLGYVSTTSSKFSSGFAYGIGLSEGRGRIGFGLTAIRFGNTYKGEVVTLVDGKLFRTGFEEDVADFVLTLLGLYRVNGQEQKNHLMVGAGPQVHFLNSSRAFSTFTESANDSRLGAAALARYQRRLDMFGGMGFVLTVSYCHMQSVASRTDLYEVPTQSMNVTTVTAGLAFPF